MTKAYAILSDITPAHADVEAVGTAHEIAALIPGMDDRGEVAEVPAGTAAGARVRLASVRIVADPYVELA